MSSPSSNNAGDDAWLMKIELKREEPMEINKDEGIKKTTEDQEHIIALKGIIRKLEDLLCAMCDYPTSPRPSSPTKKET